MVADVGHGPKPAGIAGTQFAYQDSSKVNGPHSHTLWPQSYPVADEGFAHKAQPPLPTNLSVAAHPPHRPGFGIVPALRLRNIFPGRTPVIPGRGSLAQRFVRANLIVNLHPPVEPPLLRPQRARNGLGRLAFQNPVHLFVRSVVLRATRTNELHPHSQCRPPRTQTRQARRPHRGEGAAIVHTDHPRQAIPAKQPDKPGSYPPPALIGQQPHRQHVTAEQIPHRQGFHPLAIAGPKPPFEIHRPYLIGPAGHCQPGNPHGWTFGRADAPPPRPLPALQVTRNGPHGGQPLPPMARPQIPPNLFPTPIGLTAPQPPDRLHPASGNLTRRVPGSTRSVPQSTLPLGQKPPLPLVRRGPADPKTPAHFGHRFLGLPQQFHQAASPLDQRKNFPWHDLGKSANTTSTCKPCLCLHL
jgi:hypothetical protein